MSQEQLSVAIMAGGKSSRMGVDKSFVLFDGRPMIEIVQERVAGLGAETLLITNKPDEYAHLGLPMVGDLYPDHGPLGGIFTAVHAATFPHVLVVACDMPWLNRSLLQYMITLRETADVIVPRWEKYPEPLHAIYSKRCLPPIEEKLKAQRLKITGFFSEVAVCFVERVEIERYDENGRSFANINSPDDLIEASGQ
ncbi:Molybdopterin-guanine dinucleotide biosynthesis protein MobA [hydrothermal vent metagenome]|uniref:Molybdopterin-guanine dinucleotide biosynthesis protein MobA n=1 Tax=hydrothermal vent metagenome TaxID=652676 RepID=A0A3B0VT16_9ZZZZ